MIKTVKLFGKQIDIKSYKCSSNISEMEKNEKPKICLYINLTDVCDGGCSFCFASHTKRTDSVKFDNYKLREVINELINKNILARITITGGEPFLDMEVLNSALNSIFELQNNIPVVVNTNGTDIKGILNLDSLQKIDGFHISRHHYNDDINNQIFKSKMASREDIAYVVSKTPSAMIRFNIALIKEYVGNYSELCKYLNFASDLNVTRIGVRTLMTANDYCESNFVYYGDLKFDHKMVLMQELYDRDLCECKDGVFICDSGKTVDVYFSHIKKPDSNCNYCRQLLYTHDNKLVSGFGKEKIY